MDLQKGIFILPIIALFVYTFGAFFLVFAPAGISLSPGKETLSSNNSFIASLIFLIFTAFILLFALFIRKRGRK